ncbi:MAG: bifunctional aminotransferase class I/II-fold pyridoxal phosphate-dependent enzyme/GNAT family N-acetyltransferase [bacterium]|nr:bifunctional aminotransferase class I/II-fold pyridoxal phosphate-dependent enzyme/GNAT family N-acetyltransferase [bacterium]
MRQNGDRFEFLDRLVGEAYSAGVAGCRSEDEKTDGREVTISGRRLVNFASCSYLGLELDERLKQAAVDAIHAHGIQVSASRAYLSSSLYLEFETRMAQIFDGPLVVAPTTTLGHLAAIPTLVDPEDAILLDHHAHSSLQMACKVVAADGVPVELVPHNDLERVADRTTTLSEKHRRVWYVADGVNSMTGHLAPNAEIARTLDAHPDLRLYVDDAHGMSWCGTHGSGSVKDDLGGHPQVVLTTGLAKGFGTGGGIIVLPDQRTRERVQRYGPTMVFGGPLQPAILGAALASAQIHLSDEIEQLQADLRLRMAHRNAVAAAQGVVMTSSPETPVGLVALGPVRAAHALCRRLIDEGFYINPAQFPALPVRRSGGRFLLTRHHTLDDIECLMTAIAAHWEAAVREGGSSPEEVSQTFGLEIPERARRRRPRETPAEEEGEGALRLEVADTVDKLDLREWDRLMSDRGCLTSAAMRCFEKAFAGAGKPEERWEFRYYLVRDAAGEPVLATCFTKALWKADILSSAEVSEEVERRRAEDPYHLTQWVYAMGHLLSEGEHLWLRDDVTSPASREALRLLFKTVREDAKVLGCEMRVLRDFCEVDEETTSVLEEEGWLRMSGPDSWVLEEPPADDEALLARLSAKGRLHQRRAVQPFDETYEVEVLTGEAAKAVDLDRLHALYDNVRRRSLEINTFPIPRALFEALVGAPDFELSIFRPRGVPEAEIVGFGFGYTGQSVYVPLFLGMDYDYVADRGLYRQMLRDVVRCASASGKSAVHFGYGAGLEKRRFGARRVETTMYVELDDHFATDAVAQVSIRAAS